MDKYTLLILLNVPFVIFGIIKAFSSYRSGPVKPIGLLLRLLFWATVLCGLIFAQEIFGFLVRHRLTDSTPLSIADVVEITGISFCISQVVRLYSKLDDAEKRFDDLHEKLSIQLSKTKSE